ncbi:helix-turn-helix transcriptional regulator [Saccharopolyspora hirsuta]|uniref:helix-turn-helix transcriptional regulator n=1 Tax=Saccharopolyspora hirsuta TaxID=1837 RepID=UPI001FED17DC|nr:helix-turn-helix transcriptional regulator [Saccharopolyspora hirsuta]
MAATAGTPRARALSAALREARIAAGIGVRELGRMLEYTHVEISNWETGKRVPKIETVAAILATAWRRQNGIESSILPATCTNRTGSRSA